jgi:ergothioneine biosynthesis protein EgtB
MSNPITTQERERMAARLADARSRTDEIFAVLDPAALYERPIPERHRLVFYLGHVEAFDWNLIARRAAGLEPFHQAFDQLFAFGIDPIDGGLPNEPPSAWPRRGAIEDYNVRVRAAIDDCVRGAHPFAAGVDERTVFHMAIEHRLMHAETLAYLLHQLPHAAKHAPRDGAAAFAVPAAEHGASGLGAAARAPRVVDVPAGTATLGLERSDSALGWDNEYDRHGVPVPGFGIDAHKVTNRRFLEFEGDGGYQNRELWSDAAWRWKEQHDIRHPAFWTRHDGAWHWRGMFAEVPLPLEAPVFVSHAEAAAFARWAGRALPTEAQFHRAAYGTHAGAERAYPWGDRFEGARGNFDFAGWDPTPVGATPETDSAFGVAELVGNGWEWTATPFAPFAGFQAHPFYEGYSASFFDGSHYVLKGGSPRTAACMLRRSFRNWFQPHYQTLYAAFRLVDAP